MKITRSGLFLDPVRHHFKLEDGRRFASLKCAAHSIMVAEPKSKLSSVTDEATGRVWSKRELMMHPDVPTWWAVAA